MERLASQLADIRYRQGHLLGRMEKLGLQLNREATLHTLTMDVVKSSAIEGENLNPEEVRSSLARRLELDLPGAVSPGRKVEGIVKMMLDAREFSKPLSRERLFDWHVSLFTAQKGMQRMTVGNWRTVEAGPMQVVSGPAGREKVHFEAPGAERLEGEMAAFLSWFNQKKGSVDPVLRAGVAHFWFVTIHPFEDGNGRMARAIGDMAMAQADGTRDRFYSLSGQIESERKDYYRQLERQQRGTPDITNWLAWFLDCLGRAIENAEEALESVLFKAQFWERLNQNPVNQRQRLVLNRMLENDFKGYMNTSKYAVLAKCSNDTALRDIRDLKARGIFIQNPGKGRSTSYCLNKRP